MKRKRIPAEVEAEVMFQSDCKCCICEKRGDHIHHIDGNSANHEFENLVLLCFDHHNEASVTGNLSKKLSPKTILKYRDHLYEVVETKRKKSLGKLNTSIKELTAEDLLQASKNAIIIIELEKISEEYYNSNWNEREKVLAKLNKFSEHTNIRIAYDFFSFLEKVSYGTRRHMPANIVESIFYLIESFFPYSTEYDGEQKEELIEISELCIRIAQIIVYDATIYLNNLYATLHGLNILKLIYYVAERNELPTIIADVNKVYDFIESSLNRKDKEDLVDALELASYMRKDLGGRDLTFPKFPTHLWKKIEQDGDK